MYGRGKVFSLLKDTKAASDVDQAPLPVRSEAVPQSIGNHAGEFSLPSIKTSLPVVLSRTWVLEDPHQPSATFFF